MNDKDFEEMKHQLAELSEKLTTRFDQQELQIARLEGKVEGVSDSGQPITSAEVKTDKAVEDLIKVMSLKLKGGEL